MNTFFETSGYPVDVKSLKSEQATKNEFWTPEYIWHYENMNVVRVCTVNQTKNNNWYYSDIIINDQKFNCVEQYFMWRKLKLFEPSNRNLELQLLDTKNPAEMKRIGGHVKNYNEIIWNNERYDIMKEGLYAKFIQNDILKRKLLDTNDFILVEASPYDSIWGIGMTSAVASKVSQNQWKGKNLLGIALMEVRANLS